MQKIALVTGANKGIGLQTVKQLSSLGIKVLLGARSFEKAKSSADLLIKQDLDVVPIEIDPTKNDSVVKAGCYVEEKFGRLDILVNNAGTLVSGDFNKANEVDISVFRETYEINVFGLHLVTKTFWLLLQKSNSARIVNVSSQLGSLTAHANMQFPDFQVIAYDSSKAAVNMMTIHYANLWKNTPHKVNAIHPGSVKTDLNPYGSLSVEEGAKTSVRFATLDKDGPSGEFFYMNEKLPW
jgi:NAD(P)-dependent dehydrogenase (short-subunit alcohol dehydrogenase family)